MRRPADPDRDTSRRPSRVSDAVGPNPFRGSNDWIAYQTYRDGHESVRLVHPDGTAERQLTDFDLVGGTPDWSPDGRWIVFSTHPLGTSPDRNSELFRIRPDGTGLQRLTRFRSIRAVQPRYTPNGEWIVFTADRSGQRSLMALPASGGTPVMVAHRERIYTHGTWQPRG